MEQFSEASLEGILQAMAYLPTSISILLMGTASEADAHGERFGITGRFTGFLFLVYGMAYTMGVNSKSSTFFTVLLACRSVLGMLGLMSIFVLLLSRSQEASGASQVLFAFLYLGVALLTLPEVFIMYTYTDVLDRPEPAPEAPPVRQARPPPQDDFGLNSMDQHLSPAGRVDFRCQSMHPGQPAMGQGGPPTGAAVLMSPPPSGGGFGIAGSPGPPAPGPPQFSGPPGPGPPGPAPTLQPYGVPQRQDPPSPGQYY